MKDSLFLLILLFPLSTSSYSYEAKLTKTFSVDLIHHDSPLSPMYNSSMTQSELLQNAAFRSISRHNNNFHHTPNNNATNNFGYGSKVQTTINPNNGDYLMKIYLGNPPLESLVIADTATDLCWIQCQPCSECYAQDAPIFDPTTSFTYKMQDCSSNSCGLLYTHTCGIFNECRYEEHYGDNSSSKGELVSDTISFGTSSTSYPNFLFGCGHHNLGRFKRAGSGLAGLGRGQMSLASQLGNQIGHKFSYCLNSPYFGGPKTSKLKFGSESTISGEGLVTASMVPGPQPQIAYILDLQAISVGSINVQPDNQDLIVVDSGTSLTMLESNFYYKFLSAILTTIALPTVLNPPEPFNLCYVGGSGGFSFPDITLQFGGANNGLKLEHYHTFGRLKNLLCLLIVPTEGHSILGNMAQVNFEVQYDLEENKVSFAPTDCTKE